MKQITRISPAVLTSINSNIPEYEYKEEIIVGADATRYRNGEVELSCLMGAGTSIDGSAIIGQTVVGRYNAPASNSLFIIGNGSKMSRSNIVEVSETTFSIKKDLNVEGASILKSVTVNGNAKITGTLEASTLQVTNNLTVVNGVIKGTMQTSSGTSYVTTAELYNSCYTKAQTDSKITDKATAVETSLNNSITNLSKNMNSLLAKKMDDTPAFIELFSSTPYIDFHFQSSTADYTSRIIELESGCLSINGVFCSSWRWFEKSEGATGAVSSESVHTESLYVDHFETYSHDENIVTLCGIRPESTKIFNLGTSDYRWNTVFAGSVNTSSDRNLKKDIEVLDTDQYINTFLSLKPCSYLFKDDEENQTHFGFIAQDIEESFNLLNEDKQYALYSKDEETGEYGMCYSELIALNTCMIQNLILENKELKAEIQKIKGNS